MKTKTKTIGLRQAIAEAKTKEEVNDFLVIGTQYTNVSAHTKQRWLNTARKRLKQLKATIPSWLRQNTTSNQ